MGDQQRAAALAFALSLTTVACHSESGQVGIPRTERVDGAFDIAIEPVPEARFDVAPEAPAEVSPEHAAVTEVGVDRADAPFNDVLDASDGGTEVNHQKGDAGLDGETNDVSSYDTKQSVDATASEPCDLSEVASLDAAPEEVNPRPYVLQQDWALTMSTPAPPTFALASSDTLEVAAAFTTSVTFSPNGGEFDSLDPNNSSDVLAARISAVDGSVINLERVDDPSGQSNNQFVSAVSVDSIGRTVVAGIFSGTLQVGGTVVNASGSVPNGFLVSINTDGTLNWHHVYPVGAAPGIQALDVDRTRGIVVAGGAVDLNTDFNCVTSLTPQKRAGFVVGFSDVDGSCQFLIPIEGPAPHSVSDLKVGADGGIALAGAFQQSLSTVIEPSGLTADPGDTDYFVAKLDENRQRQWGLGLVGHGQSDQPVALAVDSQGRVALAGILNGSLPIAGTTLEAPNGSSSFMTIVLSATGQILWARQLKTGAAGTTTVSFSAGGDVVVAGAFTNEFDCDTFALTSLSQDVFLAVLDGGGGSCVFARSAGSIYGTLPIRLLSGSTDDVYLMLSLAGADTIDFGTPVSNDTFSPWNALLKLALGR